MFDEAAVCESSNASAFVGRTVAEAIVIGMTLSTIVLATIVGNLFVIFAILIEKDLRRPQYYLILSLAVADLLIGCIVTPIMTVYELQKWWTFGKYVCDFWISVDVLVCTSSILHLVGRRMRVQMHTHAGGDCSRPVLVGNERDVYPRTHAASHRHHVGRRVECVIGAVDRAVTRLEGQLLPTSHRRRRRLYDLTGSIVSNILHVDCILSAPISNNRHLLASVQSRSHVIAYSTTLEW
jgi:hypothetical protein